MTIIEYAKKLGVELNSAQIVLLQQWQENNDTTKIICSLSRVNGRQMIYDLITSYNGYLQGRADGYSQAENDYFKKTEKDRQSSYDCGYQQGRQDAIDEIYLEFEQVVKNDSRTSYYWTDLWVEFMKICEKLKGEQNV